MALLVSLRSVVCLLSVFTWIHSITNSILCASFQFDSCKVLSYFIHVERRIKKIHFFTSISRRVGWRKKQSDRAFLIEFLYWLAIIHITSNPACKFKLTLLSPLVPSASVQLFSLNAWKEILHVSVVRVLRRDPSLWNRLRLIAFNFGHNNDSTFQSTFEHFIDHTRRAQILRFNVIEYFVLD